MAFYGFRGTRQWEFARFRVDDEEAEEGTIKMMEEDGWEYLTTDLRHGAEWAVFKKFDGKAPLQARFPVWEFEGKREAETASGIDRSAKMTDREKLGKKGR